jgi:hypothetical protein
LTLNQEICLNEQRKRANTIRQLFFRVFPFSVRQGERYLTLPPFGRARRWTPCEGSIPSHGVAASGRHSEQFHAWLSSRGGGTGATGTCTPDAAGLTAMRPLPNIAYSQQ